VTIPHTTGGDDAPAQARRYDDDNYDSVQYAAEEFEEIWAAGKVQAGKGAHREKASLFATQGGDNEATARLIDPSDVWEEDFSSRSWGRSESAGHNATTESSYGSTGMMMETIHHV